MFASACLDLKNRVSKRLEFSLSPAILRRPRTAQSKSLAFAMITHSRLGDRAVGCDLGSDLVKMIMLYAGVQWPMFKRDSSLEEYLDLIAEHLAEQEPVLSSRSAEEWRSGPQDQRLSHHDCLLRCRICGRWRRVHAPPPKRLKQDFYCSKVRRCDTGMDTRLLFATH